MLARILKADSVVMSLPKSVLPVGNDGTGADRQNDPLDGNESQAVLTEAKLTIYKLLNDARRQAGGIIAKAREQANQALEQDSAERELAREAAYKSGYEAGLAAVQTDRNQLAKDRAAQLQAIEQEKSRLIGEIEPAIIDLSLQIARKIIHAELKLAPEQIASIAGAVLDQVMDSDNVTLKVSADDYAAVTDALGDKTGSGAKVRFRVDHDLASGDCIAATPHGTVDGTIEGQFNEIRHKLMEAAENG
jgi:flagellar assembly protein FliH